MALQELSDAVRNALATTGSAVVAIGQDGRGSGLVIGDGRIVTNAHNLRDRTTQVTFADGRAVQAEALGIDADGDLAVLSVDTGGVTAPAWGDEPAGVGQWVLAISAGGLRGQRITAGLVSGTQRAFRGPRGRRVTGSIEHTSPMARGSSGGPLLDLAGRVVGLNTHRVERGFYLAVPADADLRRRIDELASGTAPVRRRLGVALAPREVGARLRASVGLPPRDGLLVRAVENESPAANAGIQRGDLLVRAGDRELGSPDDLYDALDAGPGSEPLALTVVRGVEELVVAVSFEPGAGPEEGKA